MIKLAQELSSITWAEMDDFASLIMSIATGENGEQIDQRGIAQALLDWSNDMLYEDPS